jgi:predicted CDP-diglyceride synthetase/phosphatidate cytidylyltransferase
MKVFLNKFVLSNLPVIIALFMLASAPFFVLQNQEDIANQYAGYAFYLLIVGIVWKIIQYLMNKHFEKNNISAKKVET